MNYEREQDVELGMRLCEFRKSMNYTQNEFAEALGIELSQYKRIEKGISRITIDKIRILHEKFCIDPNQLIIGEMYEVKNIKELFVNLSTKDKKVMFECVTEYVSKNFISRDIYKG